MNAAQVSPGTVIDGITIGDVTRSRSGAVTYQAQDRDGHPCELTLYGPECFPSALILERGLRELRQLQDTRHAHIVTILGCGRWDNSLYELHESLEGPSLAEYLRSGQRIPGDTAGPWIDVIGQALATALDAGVLHRNLGGDTVVLTPMGPKVLGFCVGTYQGGASYGALDCIAPEQVQGRGVDQRTLVYNLAALAHLLQTGQPLFSGDAQTVLSAHLHTDPGDTLASVWRRALAKDPRSRPMMLRQFLGEIAGRPPEGAVTPSSRGWTMFTQTSGDPAPVAPSTPATPAAQPRRPTTRGWTMFMDAVDVDSSAAAPDPQLPTPPASGEGVPQPTTRGWTMFMQADAPAGAPQSSAGLEAGSQQGEASQGPEHAPVFGAGDAQPTARGWTMFTQAPADLPQAPSAAGPAESATVAPGAFAAPPPAAPSPRGWTMFTDASGPVGVPAPAAPSESTRLASESSGGQPRAPSAAEPPSKRGWTVFMETPLNQAKPESLGPNLHAEPSSDTRGWTVFGMENPGESGHVHAAADRTVIVTPKPVQPQPVSLAAPASESHGAATAGDAGFADPALAKTIVETTPRGGAILPLSHDAHNASFEQRSTALDLPPAPPPTAAAVPPAGAQMGAPGPATPPSGVSGASAQLDAVPSVVAASPIQRGRGKTIGLVAVGMAVVAVAIGFALFFL